jgi:hypothetical protein
MKGVFSIFFISPFWRCYGYRNSFTEDFGLVFVSNNAGLVPYNLMSSIISRVRIVTLMIAKALLNFLIILALPSLFLALAICATNEVLILVLQEWYNH